MRAEGRDEVLVDEAGITLVRLRRHLRFDVFEPASEELGNRLGTQREGSQQIRSTAL